MIYNQSLNTEIPTYLITDTENKTAKIESAGTKFYMNKNCDNLFNNCQNLVMNLDSTFENVNWDKVENMKNAFAQCSQITGSPICGNNTKDFSYAYFYSKNITGNAVLGPNVTNAYASYMSCQFLENGAPWPDTIEDASVTYMGCGNLKTGYIGSKKLVNVEDFHRSGQLYGGCNKLSTLIISPYMTNISSVATPRVLGNQNALTHVENMSSNNVINMNAAYMFCNNLLGQPECGDNVVDMTFAYHSCSKLTGTAVIGPNVKNAAYAYEYATNIEYAEPWPDSLENAYFCYDCCSNLKTVYLGSKKINRGDSWAEQQAMSGVIQGCYNLEDIYLSKYLRNMANFTSSVISSSPWHHTKVVNIHWEDAQNVTNLVNAFTRYYPFKFNPMCSDLVENMFNAYNGCNNLIGSPVCGLNVRNFASVYQGCLNLTGSPVCGDNVINMFRTYSGCSNLMGSPVCGPKVTTMQEAYVNCSNLTGSPVCGDNVTEMVRTYYDCSNLTGSPVCGDNVTDMYYTYSGCSNLTGSPVFGPAVRNASGAYSRCSKLTGSPIYPTYLKDMSFVYYDCSNLIGNAVSSSNITDMYCTYYGCSNIVNAACGNNVTNFQSTYYNCPLLTKAVFGVNVKDIYRSYKNCCNITTSDTIWKNVTDMRECFKNDYKLSGDIYIYSKNALMENAFDCTDSLELRENYLNIYLIKDSETWNNFSTITTSTFEKIDDNTFICEEQKLYVRSIPVITISKTEPTCTTTGSITFRYEGDDEIEEEILPALGHDYDLETNICKRCGAKKPDSEITIIAKGDTYFFEKTGEDEYTSNNSYADDSEATTTFQTIGYSNLEWSVDSEESYDWLTINVNGDNKVYASGSDSGSFELADDDIIEVSYSKDGSSESGDDCAVIRFIK